jgi:DNA-binding XRE family transcriptional regulator
MSQREAAAHLGVAVGTLGRYEAGQRTTPLPVVRTMARIYRRPLREVLQHSGVAVEPLPAGRSWSPTELPQVIRALRTAAGLSTTELGRAVGPSGALLGEGAGRPSADIRRRLELLLALGPGSLAASGRA